mmetsp:Transcript_12072/g.16134  ORF Transcript_12072/g.16134 Transcript_12072/m.16134 type:complete len:80 (-) Transcript_12072:408-647(-)
MKDHAPYPDEYGRSVAFSCAPSLELITSSASVVYVMDVTNSFRSERSDVGYIFAVRKIKYNGASQYLSNPYVRFHSVSL